MVRFLAHGPFSLGVLFSTGEDAPNGVTKARETAVKSAPG
jgi:hypothetical protein